MSWSHTYRLMLSVLLSGWICTAVAQQEWGNSQYLFNLYDVNVAYAGNHHALSAALRQRSQWVGMDGAPQTRLLSVHAPLADERIGIGFRLQHESIGAREQWIPRASVAYKLQTGSGRFSFAVSGGMLRQEMNPDRIAAIDEEDANLTARNWRVNSALVGAGFFFNTRTWFLGAEFNRLNRATMGWSQSSLARSFNHVSGTAGYLLRLSRNDVLAFTTLMKWSEPGEIQMEGNITWLWNNRLWIGGGYRTDRSVVMLLEVNITTQFRLGYSYDLGTGELRNVHDGSHELFLGYNLKPKGDTSIRYF